MKKIVLLGASGSIGQQAIDIVNQHSDLYSIVGLSVGRNVDFLCKCLDEIKTLEYVSSCSAIDPFIREKYPNISFFSGDEALIRLTEIAGYDLLVNALQGFVGLQPTLNALKCGKNVALANKETLVAAGEIVMQTARENGCVLLPIDSEHSAIFQCLQGARESEVKRLIITASGGSFRDLSRNDLMNVTLKQALAHPNWSMGQKITIDSATMMNKGFEVIEARWLFGIDYELIETVLHRESVVHSMVEFIDHSVMAQLGVSDMRVPIQYALSYPQRISNNVAELDLSALAQLHFEKMDYERYPLLKLAFDLGRLAGNMPAIMNGANEEAVKAFLNQNIGFLDIEKLIFKCVRQAAYVQSPTVEQIIEADRWAHEFVLKEIEGLK